jgi:hypothetical protein
LDRESMGGHQTQQIVAGVIQFVALRGGVYLCILHKPLAVKGRKRGGA